MLRIKPPENDVALAGALERTVTTGRADRAAGRPLIDEATLNDIDAFLADWSSKLSIVATRRAAHTNEVHEAVAAARVLSVYVRDAWEAQKRRIAREGLPSALLVLYGLPQDGRVPHNVAAPQWAQWAQKLIEGDKVAVAQGYAPLANPSAAEIAAKLALAQKETPEAAGADIAWAEAQAAVAAGRIVGRKLFKEAMAQIRFCLRHESNESVRRVMRTYGAQFRSSHPPIENANALDGLPNPSA
ncbi:MAG: hypothetical protein U0559_10045 [Anaerolineae bacterium]